MMDDSIGQTRSNLIKSMPNQIASEVTKINNTTDQVGEGWRWGGGGRGAVI